MLPEAFLSRMEKQLGEEYPAFLESFDRPKHQALRLNPLKKTESGESKEQALTALFRMEKVPWAENGFYYDPKTQPGKHPYHEAGLYYIQESSAMAPVGFLDVKPGDRVLDLCAAPGGKSTQIAAKLLGDGLLVANEINPSRAKILSENIERLGVTNACVMNESPQRLAQAFPLFFDRILVDAPCSGEGMFRKNEMAQTEWSPENVTACASRQDEILEQAAQMLRPGGRMVYSTCTFAEAENEGSMKRFLESHPDFSLVKDLSMQIDESGENIHFDGMLRLYPHRVKGEGHFLAVLQKNGEAGRNQRSLPPCGVAKTVSPKECPEWLDFCKQTINRPLEGGEYLRFGNNLYFVPADFPDIKGLKVLRPGLHLGVSKKNRFEPSHALALALGAEDVKHVYSLSGDASAYLNGQTFSLDDEKGWYLVCVDGISIGWGKLAGGILKNHYPKGLRK